MTADDPVLAIEAEISRRANQLAADDTAAAGREPAAAPHERNNR